MDFSRLNIEACPPMTNSISAKRQRIQDICESSVDTREAYVVENKTSPGHYLSHPLAGRRWGARAVAIVYEREDKKSAERDAESHNGLIRIVRLPI